MSNTPVIVLVAHGKGGDRAHNFGIRTFQNRKDANAYCDRVTKNTGKYWTIAEIVEPGEAVEPLPEGFALAFSDQFLNA